MRFRKGSKVEVLSKREVPSGSWLRAVILCGNGHNYTVRFDGSDKAADATIVEKVSRNDIRPCPPALEFSYDLVPGDVVEVFDKFSWKMATISNVLGKKYFLVRLLGSSWEFKVRKTDVRVRQSWLDDKWVVIGKGSASCSNGKRDGNSTMNVNKISTFQIQKTKSRVNSYFDDECLLVKNKLNYKSQITSSIARKRESPYCDLHTGASQKFRAVENEGCCRRVAAANSAVLAKQVDFVPPRRILGSQEIHASINRTTGVSEVDVERRRTTDNAGCSFAVDFESNDDYSVACSVGSCSITSHGSYSSSPHVYRGRTEEFGDNFSDAESFCQLRYEKGNCLVPTKENLAAEIHKIELHAYRSTIEALHASGPLSWEQEELVTNLRLLLNISNDEHLIELKNLISSNISIPYR